MALAEWRFIDHTTSQDAATRKLVRATVARDYRRKERLRSVQSYVHSHPEASDTALRGQSSVQKKGESGTPNDKGDYEECTDNLNQASGHAQTIPPCCINREDENRGIQSVEVYNKQRHWAHASTRKNGTMYVNPFATSSSTGAYENEHGRLLHHCKLRHNFPCKTSPVLSSFKNENAKWLHEYLIGTTVASENCPGIAQRWLKPSI